MQVVEIYHGDAPMFSSAIANLSRAADVLRVPCPNPVSFRCHQIGARDWLGRQDLEEERPICLGDREIGMEFASS